MTPPLDLAAIREEAAVWGHMTRDNVAALLAEVERLRAESVPRSALVQVGWCGPYGIVPGGLDQDQPVPVWWIPVYVIRTDSEGAK